MQRAPRTLLPTPEVFRVTKTPWQSFAVLMRGAQRDDGKHLGVVVQPDSPVLAIEADNAHTLLDALGGHAHAVVCERPKTLSEAIERADEYLDAWLRYEKPNERCDCGTIDNTAAGKAPRTQTGSKRRSHA